MTRGLFSIMVSCTHIGVSEINIGLDFILQRTLWTQNKVPYKVHLRLQFWGVEIKDDDVDDVHVYSAVAPCYCSMLRALGKVVSFEACCHGRSS